MDTSNWRHRAWSFIDLPTRERETSELCTNNNEHDEEESEDLELAKWMKKVKFLLSLCF